MTDRRFALAEHFLATKPWELFVMVEMGVDRMHHGVLEGHGPAHRKHDPDGPLRDAILDYHVHLDGLVGRLLEHADDDTAVLVVSDHGAKRMDGGIRVNEWLRREGYLRDARASPTARCTLADVGRRLEPHDRLGRGRLLRPRLPERARPRAARASSTPADYERVRDELAERLAAIPDDRGEPIGTQRLQARGASTTRSTASRPT